MKTLFSLLILSINAHALSPWIENINDPRKQEQIELRWNAYGGEANIQFYHDLLNEMSIELSNIDGNPNKAWDKQHHTMSIKNLGGLDLMVPYGRLENITDGALNINGSIDMRYAGKDYRFTGLTIAPTQRNKPQGEIAVLDVYDQAGNRVFQLDHIHALIDHENQKLQLKNMDLKATDWLANALGIPHLANLVIGQMHIYTELNVPSGGITDLNYLRGASCANRPRWSSNVDPDNGLDLDVTLLTLSAQYRRSVSGNRIVITPSATLKNMGINNADVPWYSKFSGTFAPHNNDQHPFLNWAMYREIDGRFEQIGRSGIKHAFLTINSNCTLNCGDSHILWPDCEDVYGVGTNDSGSSLGPREEVAAFQGLWRSTGSFFDQNGDGQQDNSSNNTDENRMVVDEAKIADANDDYYISGWYTIRDDVNIYNTMGYRKYSLTDNGSTWSVNSNGSFTQGPASDAYVTPDTLDLGNLVASQRVVTSQGHLTVAAKIVDLGNGTYRYNYMVENFDFDPKLNAFTLPLSINDNYSDFVFADIDSDDSNNWTASLSDDVLLITGDENNEQDWGMIFSFSFTSVAPPAIGTIDLSGVDTTVNQLITVDTLVPTVQQEPSDIIFADSFE